MGLSLTITEDSTERRLVIDRYIRPVGLVFETSAHGYGSLSAILPMSIQDSWRYYDGLEMAHCVVSDGAFRAYEGRIEDRRLVDGGIEIGAFGYWRAFYDAPYTALWSTEDIRNWTPITYEDDVVYMPEKYHMDTNNRLKINLRKNETYATNTEMGALYFRYPHLGEEEPVEVDYTYITGLPAGFVCQMVSYADDFTSLVGEATISGTGSATASINSGKDIIAFRVLNSTAANPYTNTQDVDTYFIKITAVRIRSTTNNNVYADEIVKALVAYINGINSSQISSSTGRIESPGVDLFEIDYRDEYPGRILADLADRGDDSSPPKRYEVGVWEDQQLHFRERGSAGLDWYTDLQSLSIDSTIDTLVNSVYGAYRNDRGEDRRTATSNDTASQAKYGIIRRAAVSTYTQSGAEAGVYAEAHLEDNKDITPRAHFVIKTVNGSHKLLYMVRSGDNILNYNLPITGNSSVDKIRSFRISSTRYHVDTNTLEVTPELGIPGLVEISSKYLALQDGPPLPGIGGTVGGVGKPRI